KEGGFRIGPTPVRRPRSLAGAAPGGLETTVFEGKPKGLPTRCSYSHDPFLQACATFTSPTTIAQNIRILVQQLAPSIVFQRLCGLSFSLKFDPRSSAGSSTPSLDRVRFGLEVALRPPV